MKAKTARKVLVQGPIAPEFIAEAIAKHQSKIQIGAHDIFLGQVRADTVEGKTVAGIEYTAYEPMAEARFAAIREQTFEKFEISCMHIYHSLGVVKTGEICLFVFVSAPHRQVAFKALEFVVETLKKEVPVFGKELFDDDSYQWKVNT